VGVTTVGKGGAPEGLPDTMEDSLRDRVGGLSTARRYLFVVLEGGRPLAGGARYALEGVDEIHIGRGDERTAAVDGERGARRLTLSLPSPSLSRLHARLRRAPLGWLLEDAGSRNGSYLNGQRTERGLVGGDDILELGHVFITLRDFDESADQPARDLAASDLAREPAGFRTLLPSLATGLGDLRRLARATVGLLFIGETGTGKEVIARAIHEQSGRPGPFVAVNCNTLTEGLAESLLFGHVKGAFSGAVADTPGFVRAADKGTLLLDEVGDLGPGAQGALLRVLQEREVVPVGRPHAVKVDVRFLATSPRPLDTGAGRERFRSDLFARLSGFVYAMTPLRERREDLGLLIAALLRKAGVTDEDRPRIAPDLGLGLLRHSWPLNVRELEQLLTRTWLLAQDGLMSGEPRFVSAGDPNAPAGTPAPARALSPEEQEQRQRLLDALAAAGGNVTEAARALGTGRVQLHRVMKRLGIDADRFRE
jgi:DNA-binding NtrC family response regulator